MAKLFYGVVLCFIIACTPERATPSPAPRLIDTVSCEGLAEFVEILCIQEGDELLLQTTQPVTLALLQGSITFDSTIYITQSQPLMIGVLEGVGIISTHGSTRILQPGSQIELSPRLTITSANINNTMLQSVGTLPRSITLSTPQPTQEVVAQCQRPAHWTKVYTIQRGDTLSSIAAAAQVTLAEVQEYNCLLNPNRLSPGDTLFLPEAIIAQATAIPVQFSADATEIMTGDCTLLRWDAPEARVVYLENNSVPRSSTQEVCPLLTTTYILLAFVENGASTEHTVTINVATP